MSQTVKCYLVGNLGTGKSTFMRKLLTNKYVDKNNSSFKDEMIQKKMNFNDQKCNLETYLSNNEENLRSIDDTYFKSSDIVIFTFSVNDKKSFDDVKNTIYYFQYLKSKDKIEQPLIIMLGLKTDLERKVYFDDVHNLLKISSNSKYVEFSSKKDDNIEEIMSEIIQFYIEVKTKSSLQKLSTKKKGFFSSSNTQEMDDDLNYLQK